MEKLNIDNEIKIKLDEDELLYYVNIDKEKAERNFSEEILPAIETRYKLVHASNNYYNEKFPKLSQQCSFAASDIKDTIEWIMPSLTEIYFGPDDIVGIFGRGEGDAPKAEKVKQILRYQLNSQNNKYNLFQQWMLDSLETGLGVLWAYWDREDEVQENWYRITAQELFQLPNNPEDVLNIVDNGDNTYNVQLKEIKTIKNQPVIKNIKPGAFIWLDEDGNGQNCSYCAYRRLLPYSDIVKKGKQGYYNKNYKKVADKVIDDAKAISEMNELDEARADYSISKDNDELDVMSGETQDAKIRYLVYDHYGYYDINNDDICEKVHVVTCGDIVLKAEVLPANELFPFFRISFFQNSYQIWKEGTADYLQPIQDLKTALIRQIIINTAQNNRRQYAIDERNLNAIKDIVNGSSVVRMSNVGEKGLSAVISPMPHYPLEEGSFNLLEYTSTIAEQRTGITRYNQGLDANSLNKTATGITQIMQASQQRLRKMVREGLDSGIIPLYKYMLNMNKKFLDEKFAIRVVDEYVPFDPQDVNGDFDIEVASAVGLNNRDSASNNLMLLFIQVFPSLMQLGLIEPVTLLETARRIVQQMGFEPADFLPDLQQGLENAENQKQEMMAQQILAQAGTEQTPTSKNNGTGGAKK